MWDMNPPKVLVCVEHAGDRASVDYAALEVVRRGCGLHIVHVARPALSASCALDDVVLMGDELRRNGHLVLAEAARRAEELLHAAAPDDDRLSVSTELTHGSVVATLDRISRHAALVVLEHHGMGAEGDTATLSVTAGVASGAGCPVVAVPSGWDPDRHSFGTVGVGVDLQHPAVPTLEAALHEAARRDAHLRVIHAYAPRREPGAGQRDQVEASLRAAIVSLVSGIRSTHWTVPVDIVVRPGEADRVLLAEASTCDVMVSGRHHRKHVVGAPLGRTSRDLLRWSPCPVLVVDPVNGDALRDGLVASRP